jgi:lipid A oxidase
VRTFNSAWIVILLLVSFGHLRAETEIGALSGLQGLPHSRVRVSDGETFLADWEGHPFRMPPYYGFRLIDWWDSHWGGGLHFTHSKAYSSDQTRLEAGQGYQTLEFTDGLNPITLNIHGRLQSRGFYPFFSVGFGAAIPHVEIQRRGGEKTFGYQLGGFVLSASTGFQLQIFSALGLFIEYQWMGTALDVAMQPDLRLKTQLVTNALNLGLNLRLGESH